jgi:DNA-directed RNA polymerase subunit RPC12/RpoP
MSEEKKPERFLCHRCRKNFTMSELINGTDCPRCLYRVRVDKVCKNRSSVTCPRCRKLKTCTDPCISMKSFQNIKEPEEIL